MRHGMRILAVVPARGGSKGIKLKNLKTVRGRPLVALAGDSVRALPWIDRAVVSTDHPEIARVAREAGLDAPFLRPAELSGDAVADAPVLQHALLECERLDGLTYDIVLMLQPTSPLRRPGHVELCVDTMATGGWDAVWTVSPTDSKAHPLKQLTVERGKLDYYDPRGSGIVARQQLKTLYHRNGVAYAIARRCLASDPPGIKGESCGAAVIDEPLVSIDTEWDIFLVEAVLDARDKGLLRC